MQNSFRYCMYYIQVNGSLLYCRHLDPSDLDIQMQFILMTLHANIRDTDLECDLTTSIFKLELHTGSAFSDSPREKNIIAGGIYCGIRIRMFFNN